MSLLVHANFEQDANAPIIPGTQPSADWTVEWMMRVVRNHAPIIEQRAKNYVTEARNSAAVGYQKGGVTGDGKRKGSVHSIGITNSAGQYLAGAPVSVTLSGPAVFDETGTNTWSGKTGTDPISLTWTATGNGEVRSIFKYSTPRRTLTRLVSGQVQDTLTYGNPGQGDPVEKPFEGPSWRVIFDFQPMGVSQVQKLTDDGAFTDVFDAQADPNYGGGEWLNIDDVEGNPVPVIYEATAYYVGDTPPVKVAEVPKGAEVIGSQLVTASGPGELKASFTAKKPGFVTVVWKVVKDDQPEEYQKYIHADWADGYGIPEETISNRHNIDIDSHASIRNTKSGIYLVDDVWVDGFPEDHPNFAGDGRFGADTKTIEQSLLFFPSGVEVADDNIAAATKIASITIPAKNGFYATQGSTKFKAIVNEAGAMVPGTYVFVSNFAGDDRVAPFQSSVTDKTEQFVVPDGPKPLLHTVATNKATGGKTVKPEPNQTITDKVCDVKQTFVPGTKYELKTWLVDGAGNKLEGTLVESSFTPKSADDCANVDITFDASSLAGQKVVVFEEVYLDGELIADHKDVEDEDQSVKVEEKPLAKTGIALSGVGALTAGLLATGAGLVRARRRLAS